MATRTQFTPDPERWVYRTERTANLGTMRFSDAKAATSKRRRQARLAKKGTVFTDSPQEAGR